MPDEKARVIARAESRVPDYEAQKRGLRRFLGQEFKELSPSTFDWEPTGKPEETLRSREVAFALADGDLLPADAETAAWAESVTRREVKFSAPKKGEAPKGDAPKAGGKPGEETV